jgi:hypothetical protein
LPLIARCIRDYAPARSLLLGSPNLSLQLPIEAFERVVLGIVKTGFFDDSGGTVLVVANYGSGPEGPVWAKGRREPGEELNLGVVWVQYLRVCLPIVSDFV